MRSDDGLYIALISLHGLIRGRDPELGRDADTGGQVQYVLELARALAWHPEVARVDLMTRQILSTGVDPEYSEHLEYYFNRIPYKFTRMRYASFTRYMGHLKRLGWIEETGQNEKSTIQEDYPPAPPRVYYRLTQAGWKATPAEISNPVRTLYPKFDKEYFREKNKNHQYYSKR